MDRDGITGSYIRSASVAKFGSRGTRTKWWVVAPEPSLFTTARRSLRSALSATKRFTKRWLGR